VRLLGIDALETRGLNLDKLEKSKFLYVLDDNLVEYLKPKLTEKSIETHNRLGFKAKDFLESILFENVKVSFGEISKHALDGLSNRGRLFSLLHLV
jgi:hypothetical protein